MPAKTQLQISAVGANQSKAEVSSRVLVSAGAHTATNALLGLCHAR